MKVTIPLFAIFIGAALGVGTGRAMAQDPSYSIEDVKACSRDAIRLCKSKIAHISAIEACMRAHYADLSPACQARFSR